MNIIEMNLSISVECSHCEEIFDLELNPSFLDELDETDIEIALGDIHDLDNDCDHSFCKDDEEGHDNQDRDCEYLDEELIHEKKVNSENIILH